MSWYLLMRQWQMAHIRLNKCLRHEAHQMYPCLQNYIWWALSLLVHYCPYCILYISISSNCVTYPKALLFGALWSVHCLTRFYCILSRCVTPFSSGSEWAETFLYIASVLKYPEMWSWKSSVRCYSPWGRLKALSCNVCCMTFMLLDVVLSELCNL